MKTIRLLIIALCFVLSFATGVKAEYFTDVIVTSSNGIWTDSRAYSTLNLAISAVGADQRTVKIVSPQSVTSLTVPANVVLEFERDGSINNSGQLTINTRNIISPSRQIFTGAGDIDFALGTEVRLSWFHDLLNAVSMTSDDSVSLVIDEPITATASCTVGNNVVLKWKNSGNIITVSDGVTLTINGSFESGLYQVFSCVGTGSVIFGDDIYPALVHEVYPEWWGIDGTADNIEIQKAIDSLYYGGIVRLLPRLYSTTGTITVGTGLKPMTILGSGDYESSSGTRIIYSGPDSAKIFTMKAFSSLEDLFISKSGTYTDLYGVYAAGTQVISIIIKNVHVKACTVGFHFADSYYDSIYDATASYCTIGFQLGTGANNINFYSVKTNVCGTGIKTIGTGTSQVAWIGAAIELSTVMGIDIATGNNFNWVFTDTYFEANANSVKIVGYNIVFESPYFNHDTGTVFEIVAGCGIEIRNVNATAGMPLANMYVFSGAFPASYGKNSIVINKGYSQVAGSYLATAFLTYPQLLTDNIINLEQSGCSYVTTPELDASAAPLDFIVNKSAYDKISKYITLAYLDITTQIVTNNTFRIRIGYVGSGYNQLFDTTYTETLPVGVTQLTLIEPMHRLLSTDALMYYNAAGTSGKYKLALLFVP